jgi:protein O-mannosyl-transferase
MKTSTEYSSFGWRGALAMLAVLALAAWIYLPGLTGPTLLDDDNNLAPLLDYLSGQSSAANVILGNKSGEFGRPLSMASFVANAAMTGASVYALKATNLALHLLTGFLVILLLQRLLARDPLTARHARWIGLLLGAAWLLHPIQISTVLYVIQRMAMLAALFSIAALLVYVAGRERIERGQPGGAWLLFGAFPLLLLLGLASKENAILTPLLAGILEWTLFAPVRGVEADRISRPTLVITWLTLFVAIPVVLGTFALIWLHDGLLNYAGRDFTLVERVLTEARILWDYIGAWLLPLGDRLGVFHDNYTVSIDLLSPPTTVVALLGWAAVMGLALFLRRHAPVFSAGALFFLCGHLLESSILPLELYFEHRNYLPSLGLLLALTGLVAWLSRRLPEGTSVSHRLGFLILIALLPAYAFATWVQAGIWGNATIFWAQQEASHPDSVRVRAELSNRAIEARNLPEALRQIDLMEPHVESRDAMMPQLRRILAYCLNNQPVPTAVFDRIEQAAHGEVSNYTVQVWPVVVDSIESGKCPAVDANRLADIGKAWLEQTSGGRNDWLARFSLSLLLASQSRFVEAETQAQRAWKESGHHPHFGVFLYQLEGTLENKEAQEIILRELEQHVGEGDSYIDHAVQAFRKAQQ